RRLFMKTSCSRTVGITSLVLILWMSPSWGDGPPPNPTPSADTGAPVLKAQHPEFEMWNQGIHNQGNTAGGLAVCQNNTTGENNIAFGEGGFAQQSQKPVAPKPTAPPAGGTQKPGTTGGKLLTVGECWRLGGNITHEASCPMTTSRSPYGGSLSG